LQGYGADHLAAKYRRMRQSFPPKIGRPKKPFTTERFLCFVGSSLDDIQEQTQRLSDLIGPKVRGNKRWGRIHLYNDLLNHFLLLRRIGVTLPRGNEMSAEACKHGLVEILLEHRLTEFSRKELQANSTKRKVLAGKMRRIFERVASAVTKSPVHK
jgi:hypothetical protein